MLGITEEQLRDELRAHRTELPARDARYPNLFTQEFVDQLRALVRQHKAEGSTAEKEGAVVFAVTSGKGGVGKTSLSVNLACEFARRGYRTLVIDTDLGLANTHILAGVKPTKTLSDYIEGKATLNEVILDGPTGVKFVSGGSGVKEMADLDASGRKRILEAVRELKPFCDVILLDTGAGVSSSVTDFVSASDHTIVVTTSNFAAIADAYGIIKIMVQEGYRRGMHLLVNRVRSPEEAEQVYKKLKGCSERFLSFELNWLGLLPEDNSVEGAVIKRTPFCEAYPSSVATRYLKKVVTALERFLPAVPQQAGT
jgi:flagellar biosynthesis protein FlhG